MQKQAHTQKGDSQPARMQPITGPNYRMSGAHKTLLASEVDPVSRGQLKRMLIEAQVYASNQAVELSKKRDKKSTPSLTD